MPHAVSMKFAAIQMTSDDDVAANLRVAGRLVAAADDQGARLVLLPENFGLMALRAQDKVAAREEDEEAVDRRALPSEPSEGPYGERAELRELRWHGSEGIP